MFVLFLFSITKKPCCRYELKQHVALLIWKAKYEQRKKNRRIQQTNQQKTVAFFPFILLRKCSTQPFHVKLKWMQWTVSATFVRVIFQHRTQTSSHRTHTNGNETQHIKNDHLFSCLFIFHCYVKYTPRFLMCMFHFSNVKMLQFDCGVRAQNTNEKLDEEKTKRINNEWSNPLRMLWKYYWERIVATLKRRKKEN